MMNQQTLTKLKALKLDGMARAFEEQLAMATSTSLSFEERFAMLADRECTWRDNRRLARLLKQAKLRNPQACLEDVDYRPSRGLERRMIAALVSCDWIRHAQNVLLTGRTGVGKTWLACALANAACRQGFSALYLRTARLVEQLKIAHGDGSFHQRLASLARIDVLVIDDWALGALDAGARADLLEVFDDRVGTRSTIINSQLPVENWHTWLGEPTLADAILDRLLHWAYRVALKGPSPRKEQALA